MENHPIEPTGAPALAINGQGPMATTMEPDISEEEAQERAQLAALAAKYHLSLMPSRALLGSLGKGITDRMIQRIGGRCSQ